MTKVGMQMPSGKGLSRSHILASAEELLRRLNTDHIDLYQAHCEDPSVALEETLEAFAELIRAGKVRAIGASNYTAPRLAEALAVSKAKGLPSFVSLQPNYSLVARSNFEGASAAALPQRGAWRHSLLCARRRLSDGQIPPCLRH